MAEVLFYHFERRNLEDVLPALLERTRERRQTALVRVGGAERLEALDRLLWTYSDTTFLAHGTGADGRAERQPIYLTTGEENPNSADILFLVDGALIEDWKALETQDFARIAVLFDGGDSEAVAQARQAWKVAKEAGHVPVYWKESPSGKWEKQD